MPHRILYAEDKDDTRFLITLLLKYAGFEVTAVSNGMDALKQAGAEQFDLYLLDYTLPNVSTLEICKAIREFDTHRPILFYSARVTYKEREEALNAGAQDCLTQPDDLLKIVDHVSRWIEAAGRPPSLLPKRKRLLCIDDNKHICSLLIDIFKGLNYQVISVHGMMDALRLAQAEHFGLHILENRLPDGTGLEFTRKLREFDKTTPILFYTADAFNFDWLEAQKAGAQAYVSKLDDFHKLINWVKLLAKEGEQTIGAEILADFRPPNRAEH